MSLVDETLRLEPLPELISLVQELMALVDSNPEPRLKSLLTKLLLVNNYTPTPAIMIGDIISLGIKIISLASSVDLDFQRKPESELMSLFTESISVFKSMDLDSQPEPLKKLISLASPRSSFVDFRDSFSDSFDLYSVLDKEFLDLLNEEPKVVVNQITPGTKLKRTKKVALERHQVVDNLHQKLYSLVGETLSLQPEPKLISIIHQMLSLVLSKNSDLKKLISFCPQLQVILKQGGKFQVIEKGSWNRADMWDFLMTTNNSTGGSEHLKRQVLWRNNSKWDCLPLNWFRFSFSGEDEEGPTHYFICGDCYGQNHKENSQAPVEIKHPLHPKHSLQLALFEDGSNMQCYCCDEDLHSRHADIARLFYFCTACDFGIKFTCVKKPQVLSIDRPKWHDHTLALFPSQAPFTCSLCALTHSRCPFYICPPCDFVVHKWCLSLPHVIKISRHPYRISFTYSFKKGNWSCGICRKQILNDYGGYYCINNGFPYAAHSKCATQRNVWDGVELEGVPEEELEQLEPFVTISDGIIQHFSHKHHHLRLDENTGRDYNEYKMCQACITPIYFSNFYSCLKCDFILHQDCAKLSRRIHHPIHPHPLTLATNGPVDGRKFQNRCSACPSLFRDGFFYKCGKIQCRFRLHVQCATISEPLEHPSHLHLLFLTSKPDEVKSCSVCKKKSYLNKETFNCIEEECDFSLCFGCATLPQKVRYKHDQHILPLSYEKNTSTMTYWCEACEGKINPEEGFYKCDEYCCVNLHITCMLGKDLYANPGSSYMHHVDYLHFLPNNMSRPICPSCKIRCPHKIVFQFNSLVYCSLYCTPFMNP